MKPADQHVIAVDGSSDGPADRDRRDFLGAAVAGIAVGGVMLGEAPGADTQTGRKLIIEALRPAEAPAAAAGYSPGISTFNFYRAVFVSGQGPADLTADMETQIRQTFDRIGLILKTVGADFKNVVMLRSYFVHMARDLPIYRQVRMDFLQEPYPASTAVGVTELAIPGLEIEIAAVAVL